MAKMRKAGIILTFLSAFYRTVFFLASPTMRGGEYSLMTASEDILSQAAPIFVAAAMALYMPSLGGTLAVTFSLALICLTGYWYIFVFSSEVIIGTPRIYYVVWTLLETIIPAILLLIGGSLVLAFSKPLVWRTKREVADKTAERLRLTAIAWGMAGILGGIALFFVCPEGWHTYLCHSLIGLLSYLSTLGAGIWFAWSWSAFWGGILLVALPAAWLISDAFWFAVVWIFWGGGLPSAKALALVAIYKLPWSLFMLPPGVLFLLSQRRPVSSPSPPTSTTTHSHLAKRSFTS